MFLVRSGVIVDSETPRVITESYSYPKMFFNLEVALMTSHLDKLVLTPTCKYDLEYNPLIIIPSRSVCGLKCLVFLMPKTSC